MEAISTISHAPTPKRLIQAWCMHTVFDPCNADTARKAEAYQPDF